MPTYQYACTACGHQLEAVQSFADEPLTECPACEGRLRKRFNSVGIVFKGSGFYRTDSRSGTGTVGPSAGSTSAKPGSSSDGPTSTGTGSSTGTGGSDGSGASVPKQPAASSAGSASSTSSAA